MVLYGLAMVVHQLTLVWKIAMSLAHQATVCWLCAVLCAVLFLIIG